MSTSTLRVNTTNHGGISDQHLRAALTFYVVYTDADGEVKEIFHSSSRVSVKQKLESMGVAFDSALVEALY